MQHWCDGGETRLDNLVLLCRHHHRLLHQEGYEIVKRGERQFEFLTPSGCALKVALVPQFAATAEDVASETLAIEKEHDGRGLAIDSRTAVTRWEGEKMDYDLAVGAMLRGRMLRLSAGRWNPGAPSPCASYIRSSRLNRTLAIQHSRSKIISQFPQSL